MGDSADFFASLSQALGEIHDERVALEKQLSELVRREELVRQALGEVESGADEGRVSDDKLELVRNYMSREKRARQADVTHAVKENSGTVSVALRRMQRLGEVRRMGKKGGSYVWEWVED